MRISNDNEEIEAFSWVISGNKYDFFRKGENLYQIDILLVSIGESICDKLLITFQYSLVRMLLWQGYVKVSKCIKVFDLEFVTLPISADENSLIAIFQLLQEIPKKQINEQEEVYKLCFWRKNLFMPYNKDSEHFPCPRNAMPNKYLIHSITPNNLY